jgi:hypothetical protein
MSSYLRTQNGQCPCAEGALLRASQGPEQLAPGEWMETHATLSATGRVNTECHIFTTNPSYGFRGGTCTFLLDRAENIIANTPLRSYDVDGTRVAGRASAWNVISRDHLPTDACERCVKLAILHILAPTSRLEQDVDEAAYRGKPLAEAVVAFTRKR